MNELRKRKNMMKHFIQRLQRWFRKGQDAEPVPVIQPNEMESAPEQPHMLSRMGDGDFS
jgi:hypothetical protein